MISGTSSFSSMAVTPSRPPKAPETTANESFLPILVANEPAIPLKATKLEMVTIRVNDNTANSLGVAPVRYCRELVDVLEISFWEPVWCLTELSLRTTWIGIA